MLDETDSVHPRELLSAHEIVPFESDITKDVWRQMYPDNKDPLWIYSAYLDDRGQNNVVVMAILRTQRVGALKCIMADADGQKQVVSALKKITKENWKLLYSAFRVFCPVDHGFVPVHVAVYNPEGDKLPHHFIPVHDKRASASHSQWRSPLAVCVKPMHYDYNRAVWLVEFLEFHRLLGVSHFYLYNHSVGPDVQKVLDVYQQQGIVVTLPWNLPVRSQLEIRTEGIFAALNDCLYRTTYVHNYTMMVDFDEFIIPRIEKTYLHMLARLRREQPTAAAFIFQNVFYYLYWDNDTEVVKDFPKAPYLITLFKTKRVLQPQKHGSRSKFIVIPELTKDVGNHNVWEVVKGKKNYAVPSKYALSHHYRICEYGGFECLKAKSTIDRTTWRYKDELLDRVEEICASAFPEEGTCPPAPPLGSPW